MDRLILEAKAIVSGSDLAEKDLIDFTNGLAQALKLGELDYNLRVDLFEALRIACRHPACAKIFSSEKESFEKLLHLAGLFQPARLEQAEAAKAVLNIFYHEEALRSVVLRGTYFEHALEALEGISEAREDLFERLRFVFLCTALPDGANMVLNRQSSIDHLISLTEKLSRNSDVNKAVLLELLRILFNVSGGLKEDHGALQSRLYDLVKSLMHQSDLPLRTEAFVIALNLPAEADFSLKALFKLVDEVTSFPEPSTIPLHGVLVAIAKIAYQNPDIRKGLRKTNACRDRSVNPEIGDATKARLIRMLRSDDSALVDAAGRLLMALCKDKPYLLIYHVGYGNAAGYLYSHFLLLQNSPQGLHDLPQDASSDEEELHKLQSVNAVTGTLQGPPAGADMTPEEKEAEATRLMELFQKLEDTGFIKVMPQ